ncbi:methyltransferase [Ulvibacterium sp.]|uniref:tRNA1(Val) (adenine(37)-N6)-methyltransferase n=1 Tax=Ulvibacterium sp. TaxID=2665914 RepID=UPI00262A1881|nr:methyltransferase [Ulvibacterium sp.]
MSKPFQFKQFTIRQDRCAMKVGTDGVLLGAWASVTHNPTTVLDIGAGTGLLALMLAQRSNAETIDALEIDDAAFEQCVENFEASPWADRLFCYHAGLNEFCTEVDDTYDLIVSNPPFYAENVSSGDGSRDMARQNVSLPFKELLRCVSQLLAEEGVLAIIVPFKEERRLIQISKSLGLFPKRITQVRGNPTSEVKRSLLEFTFQEMEVSKDELILEVDRHKYTLEYRELAKDFYLKM